MERFPGRIALQQRVLPVYRAPFFDLLAGSCDRGLSVFAGQPGVGEAIASTDRLQSARLAPARNWHIGRMDWPLYLCWQAGILGWLEAWQPDALIVEANPRYLSSRLAVRWMHSRGRPVVGWGLGAPPINGLLTTLRRWERLSFLKTLDGVIAYSRRGAEEYRALGLSGKRVFVAPNAVTPRPPRPAQKRPIAFTGKPAVLFVGRLQQRKRIDLLLRACAALPDALQPWLVIVGDGPAREELEMQARAVYPLAEFAGARHGTDLATYFESADLFVLPGTGGLAVQQAMAHGLPVVVAEGDGTQEDLVRPGNGWQIPAGDLQALIGALHEALSDAARLRWMGEASYRIVRDEANIEEMVRVFIKTLRIFINP